MSALMSLYINAAPWSELRPFWRSRLFLSLLCRLVDGLWLLYRKFPMASPESRSCTSRDTVVKINLCYIGGNSGNWMEITMRKVSYNINEIFLGLSYHNQHTPWPMFWKQHNYFFFRGPQCKLAYVYPKNHLKTRTTWKGKILVAFNSQSTIQA